MKIDIFTLPNFIVERKEKIIKIALAITVVAILFFYFAPIIISGVKAFRPRRLTLNTAKNYYSILSSFITVLVGVIGLSLGYYYYIGRHEVEKTIADIERKRKRMDDLIQKIESYDAIVNAFINKYFDNDEDLSKLRNQMTHSFDTIEIMLELSDNLLGLNDEDVQTIVRVNSFVEQNEIIMRAPLQDLSAEILNSIRDRYAMLIAEAIRVCYKRVC